MTAKIYKMTDISLALRDAGASPYNRTSLLRLEKEGRITFPKDAVGRRVLSEGMMNDMIQAFRPGGIGEWHFDSERNYDET